MGIFPLSSWAQKTDIKKEYSTFQKDSILYHDKQVPPGRFQVMTGQYYPNWKPHLGKGFLQLPDYYRWKQKLSSQGLDYLFMISPVAQYGNQSNSWHSNVEFDLLGQWRLKETNESYSHINFWFFNITRLTAVTTRDMSIGNGLTVNTIGGIDTEVLWMIGTLYYEQGILDKQLKFRAGHLFTNFTLALNKYMVDDRETYLNGLINAPTGVQWTSHKSLGFQVQWDQPLWYGIVGFQDQNGDPRYPDFQSFTMGNYVYYTELGFTPWKGSTTNGKYSVTINYNSQDDQGPSGHGVVLNVQQDLTNHLAFFGRYGQSFQRVGQFDNAFATGLAINKPFGWDYDQISFAYLQGNPSNPSLKKQDKGFNIYYKFLLTYRTDFSIDFQYYFERSLTEEGNNNPAVLLAGRLRFIL